jgi:hypothetical protein
MIHHRATETTEKTESQSEEEVRIDRPGFALESSVSAEDAAPGIQKFFSVLSVALW